MRAILEITSDAMRGHKRKLRESQIIEAGRSAMVDFCIENDPGMSARHFRIRTDRLACYLEDLGSANGTLVNGKLIEKATVLRDQDQITAGTTSFRIHLTGIDETVAYVPLQSPAGAQENGIDPTFETEVAASGIYQHRGDSKVVPPTEIFKRLLDLKDGLAALMIVDRKSGDVPQVPDQPANERLFGWYDEDLAPGASPIIFRADTKTVGQLLEVRWGKDALVTVFWGREDDAPVEQIQRCAGAYANPSLIRPQLTASAAEIVNDLMIGIELILVEDESPETWVILSREDLTPELEKIGLKSSSEPQPTSTTEHA